MEMTVNSPIHLIIMGDMNFYMNDRADDDTIAMKDLIDSLNVRNNILAPAHRLHNNLYVVLTDTEYTGISQVKRGILLSDHDLITFSVATRSNTANHKNKVIADRKYKTIDNKVFADQISMSLSDSHLRELMLDESADM